MPRPKIAYNLSDYTKQGIAAAFLLKNVIFRKLGAEDFTKTLPGRPRKLMDTVIGVDLAKNVFQLHGASTTGNLKFRKKLSRPQFRKFMAEHLTAMVVMEACGSAHYWAREMVKLGHEVRLIAPQYVKPFVKRQKNDAADAEAIVIAAQRPEMRFVEPKSEEQQARAMLFRSRQRLVRQRTDLVNALRAAVYEFGHTVPQGIEQLKRIAAILKEPNKPKKRSGLMPRQSNSRSWRRGLERRAGCKQCQESVR
ncbi:transposase [Bradyrhizobium sp. CIR3A]|nr:transposase [Bradyrhizobium sp. CIR3A]